MWYLCSVRNIYITCWVYVGSSFDSTLPAPVNYRSSYDSLNSKHHIIYKPWEDTWIQSLKMAPKMKTVEFPTFSIRSFSKLLHEKAQWIWYLCSIRNIYFRSGGKRQVYLWLYFTSRGTYNSLSGKHNTFIQSLKVTPKTKTEKFPAFSFRSVSKLPIKKRNECEIVVQYVISTLQARVNGGSSYDSTLQEGVNGDSSYDTLNGKHHTLRRYLDPVS